MSWSCDHVHFRASDMNETVEYYQKNFDAVKEYSRESGGSTSVGLDIGGLKLIISSAAEGKSLKPGSTDPQFGLEHFGLVCENLEQEIAKLKSKGVEFTMELTEVRPGTKISFVKAPDEVLIELLQRD